ncbi:MAG TPA: hypothetical protein DCQ31_12175 [Bacteroidales bacterium]|nr:hypothetical protein [Bacteroidales bacterium]
MYKKSSEELMKWNSSVSYLKFQKKLNSADNFNAQISYTNYNAVMMATEEYKDLEDKSQNTFSSQKISSKINDFAGKIYYETQGFLSGKTKLGAEYIYHILTPSEVIIENDTELIMQVNKVYKGNEYAFFVDYKQTILEKLELNLGFRYSFYSTANFSYAVPEPRFSALYTLSPNHSLKAAFTKNAQYMHMLSNFSVGMPNDAWVPVTNEIPFQTAYQYNLGYSFQNTKINSDFGIEVFYKTFDNQIDFIANLSLLTPYANWENTVAKNGLGRAKGIELWWHKSFGDLNGWLAYTWSNSERKFDEINSGKWFPFKYDRRHDFSATVSYLMLRNLTVSATWVYATGNAVTLPVGVYEKFDEQGLKTGSVLMYSDRNMQRMPLYHRLDLGAKYTKKKSWGELSYCFDIYNAYNRQNAYYFTVDQSLGEYKLYQRSLFPILPTAGIEFKF